MCGDPLVSWPCFPMQVGQFQTQMVGQLCMPIHSYMIRVFLLNELWNLTLLNR